MGTAITPIVIVAIIAGFVIWLSLTNRKAGAESQRVGDLLKNDEVKDAQLKAATEPHDPVAIADRLRKHGF